MSELFFSDPQWQGAQRAVAKLREEFPDASDRRLLRQLLKESCLRAGAVGAGTTAVGLLPGVGKMLGWAVSFAGDAAMLASVQRDLVLRIFAIYGRKPTAQDSTQVAEWMAKVGVGGVAILEQVGGGVLRSLGKRIVGKVIRRGLPLAEILGSSATHIAGTYMLARKVDDYCSGSSTVTAEVDTRRIKNWAMLSVETVVDDEQPKTVKDALRHPEA